MHKNVRFTKQWLKGSLLFTIKLYLPFFGEIHFTFFSGAFSPALIGSCLYQRLDSIESVTAIYHYEYLNAFMRTFSVPFMTSAISFKDLFCKDGTFALVKFTILALKNRKLLIGLLKKS